MTIAFSHHYAPALFDTVAMYAARAGRLAEAAQLLGAADTWFEKNQDKREPAEAKFEMRTVELLEQALPAAEIAQLRDIGRHLDAHTLRSLQARVLGTQQAAVAGAG
jgi:hypothetical protein